MSREDDDTPVEHHRDEELDLDAIKADSSMNANRHILPLVAEVRRLRERQAANLATIVKLANTVPFDDEVRDALDQRGALLAEVGTLRARVAELEAKLDGIGDDE